MRRKINKTKRPSKPDLFFFIIYLLVYLQRNIELLKHKWDERKLEIRNKKRQEHEKNL